MPLPSRKAQLQTLSSQRNDRLLDRVEYLSGALVMMTTASSNQTSLAAFTSLTRFFGAADRHSLYFLATWRKGGVQRSGTLGELIGDACRGTGPGSGLNSKMLASQERATCKGLAALQLGRRSDSCSAASEDLATDPSAFQFRCETARYYTQLSWHLGRIACGKREVSRRNRG